MFAFVSSEQGFAQNGQYWRDLMKLTYSFLIGSALALTSTYAVAAPGSKPAPQQTTAATQQGSTQLRGPSTTGQPNASCETSPGASTPGRASNAPGSAFNPDGTAGSVYAGQQPQNSRNSASVSQYDVACVNQPR
jgi:hypothetical protein